MNGAFKSNEIYENITSYMVTMSSIIFVFVQQQFLINDFYEFQLNSNLLNYVQ